MKIHLISGHRRDPDAGASKVYVRLEEGLPVRDFHVKTSHAELYDTDFGRVINRKILIPRQVARYAYASASQFDIIEVAGNIGAHLFKVIRQRKAERPLLICRLHGLEVLDEEARMREDVRRIQRVPWRYRLFTRHLTSYYERQTVKLADVVICHTSRDADAIVAAGWKEEIDIAINPLGVDECFHFPQRQYQSGIRILWWGSWVERKGKNYLPRILELVSRQVDGIRLTIGGSGQTPQSLLPAFPVQLHPKIEVLPFVRVDEYVRILQNHDIFLFPSLSEGFGLALVEAMASGMPAVTTFTGIAHDLLAHGKNCLLVPMAAPTSTANAIVMLARDSALRRHLGHQAARDTKSLTWRRFAELTRSVYTEHLERYRRVTADSRARS